MAQGNVQKGASPNRSQLPRTLARRILIFCLFLFAPLHLPAQVSAEYQIKAVFLFRFADFIEWPSEVFSSPQSPIVLGVLGPNPFGNALQLAVRGEKIGGRSLVVAEFQRLQDVRQCQVLFISNSEAPQMAAITASLRGKSVLTVSDSPNFIAQGGIIQFVTEGNHVRFRINRPAAEAERLKLSSKLLRLSEE